MGGAAVDADGNAALARCGHDDGACSAGGVVYEARFRLELGEIILAGAFHAAFLAHGERHFDGAVRNFFFLYGAEHGEDGAHAADVVAGEDGLAVRMNDAFLFVDDRADVAVVGYAVHMRGEQHRFNGRIAGQYGVQIARVSAEDLSCSVFRYGEAEIGEFLLQYVRDGPFLAGIHLDRYQFLKFFNDALLVHRTSFI